MNEDAKDPTAVGNAQDVPVATMQKIADRLNLSVATVSRALRRVPGIKADTRARVTEMAVQMGYQLPKSYKSAPMEDKQLHHVGVLVATPSFESAPPYITGLTDAAMSLNASLVVHYERPENCERLLNPNYQPRAMSNGLLSGLILIFHWPAEVVHELSSQMPTVSIAHRYPEVDVDTVGIDNQGGIELLMAHLHRLGHRRIGFLGRSGEIVWARARFGAYVASLTDLGLPYRPEWIIDVDVQTLRDQDVKWDSHAREVERLVREQGVTAWICVAEPAARRLQVGLAARGLQVPEDVSITGFHRHAAAALPGEVQLTSVTASYQAIGAAALKRLLYRIANPVEATRMIFFRSELYPGSTVGPPPRHED